MSEEFARSVIGDNLFNVLIPPAKRDNLLNKAARVKITIDLFPGAPISFQDLAGGEFFWHSYRGEVCRKLDEPTVTGLNSVTVDANTVFRCSKGAEVRRLVLDGPLKFKG